MGMNPDLGKNLLSPWKSDSPKPSFRNSPTADIRNPVEGKNSQDLSGSRLASAAAGLGRDDEL
jgi:hypothetical protein